MDFTGYQFAYQSRDDGYHESSVERQPKRDYNYNRCMIWTYSEILKFSAAIILARNYQDHKNQTQSEIKQLFHLLLGGLTETIRFVTIVMDFDSL